METTNRDTAQNAAPQNDWRNAETNESITEPTSQYDESGVNPTSYFAEDREEEPFYALASNVDPDEEEDESDTEDDEEAGDWGHIDPAESNSPFPDPNAPTAPGSAV